MSHSGAGRGDESRNRAKATKKCSTITSFTMRGKVCYACVASKLKLCDRLCANTAFGVLFAFCFSKSKIFRKTRLALLILACPIEALLRAYN
jgi:hypothetical protein